MSSYRLIISHRPKAGSGGCGLAEAGWSSTMETSHRQSDSQLWGPWGWVPVPKLPWQDEDPASSSYRVPRLPRLPRLPWVLIHSRIFFFGPQNQEDLIKSWGSNGGYRGEEWGMFLSWCV